MKKALVAMVVLCLSAAPALAAGPNMTDGQWEMTMKMDMPGLPFAMPPITYSRCLTSKDLVPSQQDKNKECTTISSDIKGDTVSWVSECKDKKGVVTRSTGAITYKQDTFDGTISVTSVPAKAGEGSMSMKMAGRRIGACP